MDDEDEGTKGKSSTMEVRPDMWFDEYEKILQEWGEQAKILVWLHSKSSGWFSFIDTALGLPNGVLQAILSISLFATVAQNEEWVRWVQASLSAFVAVLIFLQSYLKYQKRGALHREKAAQYYVFAIDVETELKLPPYARTRADSFFNKSKMKWRRLSTLYPPIPSYFVWFYQKKFTRSGLSNSIGNLNRIKIHSDNDMDVTEDIETGKINSDTLQQAINHEDKNAKDDTLSQMNSYIKGMESFREERLEEKVVIPVVDSTSANFISDSDPNSQYQLRKFLGVLDD
jgi:hypothetical protein